jgi:hypothetical protein
MRKPGFFLGGGRMGARNWTQVFMHAKHLPYYTLSPWPFFMKGDNQVIIQVCN